MTQPQANQFFIRGDEYHLTPAIFAHPLPFNLDMLKALARGDYILSPIHRDFILYQIDSCEDLPTL